jgi:hypothetical protein
MKFLRRSLILILPLLLLLAQHGALAHALSHLTSDGAPAQEQSLVHLKLCGKCLSAEKLTHFSACAAPVPMEAARYRFAPDSERVCSGRSFFPYQSRAPPTLL